MDEHSWESYNVRGSYIRHFDFLGELSERGGNWDDFAFSSARRGPDLVSLVSVNLPGRMLRHRDFRIHLERPAGPSDQPFSRDATFALVPGLADARAFSFRSYNVPDRYLRHRDFHLWLEAPSGPQDEQFHRDATFFQRPVSVSIDPGTVLLPE